jgi:hypothetical protein
VTSFKKEKVEQQLISDCVCMWWWVYFQQQQQQQPHLWRCYWGLVAVVAQHGRIECHQRLGSIQLRRYYYRVYRDRRQPSRIGAVGGGGGKKGGLMGLSRALGGRKSIVGKSKKKKSGASDFLLFFPLGLFFGRPAWGVN